ncbi:polyprenyl synthetase family protein [Aliiroseovarius sp.]|uniref:polyprenyl synthetase family protein n=1 Tax=Aliiroseovarius sp. TaxID=1872442 RepID=UPI003BAA89E2
MSDGKGFSFQRLPDTSLDPLPFPDALKRAQGVVASSLEASFRGQTRHGTPDLIAAMKYALDGGKGLRAFLVLEGARVHNISAQSAGGAALAVECLHAYSLIHDDLPCMDDDDLRRGKPTVHRRWNEHTAVLAGDALQALCFWLLTHASIGEERIGLKLVRRMAAAAGHSGMVGGQMADIMAETRKTPYSLDQIIAIQNGKTGALIRWSATAGAILADAEIDALDTYGDKLGLAFQIWDDVLDVEGDAEAVGKAVGKDADAGKATFVSLLGLDAAKARARTLIDDACDALSPYGDDAETLREAARFVISRDR